MAVRQANQLGCGREIDEVWDKVDLPPDTHEQSCPDCQAARESLTGLNAAAQEMARSDREDPLLQVDTAVFDHIVSIARAEVRRGRRLPLRQPAAGQSVEELTVSEQTVASIVRRLSDQIPGIETRRCRVELAEPTDGQDVAGAPATYLVTLRVSASGAVAIPEMVDDLRRRVIAAITATIGVRVSTVNVIVEDLHDA